MKTHADPHKIPQTEGHPEPFPKVTTMPDAWDLSELKDPQQSPRDTLPQTFPIRLDAGITVKDNLS